MDFIDLYVRQRTRAVKSAPTAWEGEAGKQARARGIRTEAELAVVQVIQEAHRSNKDSGAYLTDGDIARRLKASPDSVARIVQNLVLRGVVRSDGGMLGVRRLIPVGGDHG
jgi:hypothetical protein